MSKGSIYGFSIGDCGEFGAGAGGLVAGGGEGDALVVVSC